jgi:hypothetical protein
MENLKLENLNLVELSKDDTLNINGGGWRDGVIGWLIGEVMDGIGAGLAQPCKPCPCKK